MTMKRAKKRLRRLEKQRHLSQSFSLSRAATRSSFAKNASGAKGERRKLSPERARKDENDEPGLRERPSSSRIGHALARFLGVHRRRQVACCALCSRSSSRRAATASRRDQQRAQMLLEALHVFFLDREREPHFLESEKEILELNRESGVCAYLFFPLSAVTFFSFSSLFKPMTRNQNVSSGGGGGGAYILDRSLVPRIRLLAQVRAHAQTRAQQNKDKKGRHWAFL